VRWFANQFFFVFDLLSFKERLECALFLLFFIFNLSWISINSLFWHIIQAIVSVGWKSLRIETQSWMTHWIAATETTISTVWAMFTGSFRLVDFRRKGALSHFFFQGLILNHLFFLFLFHWSLMKLRAMLNRWSDNLFRTLNCLWSQSWGKWTCHLLLCLNLNRILLFSS
jgi:hypothetical protein